VWIDTLNINTRNVNKRLENLLAWLAMAQPDVVCLQELKVTAHRNPGMGRRSGSGR
jgi:exodeoxyribonuclease-3